MHSPPIFIPSKQVPTLHRVDQFRFFGVLLNAGKFSHAPTINANAFLATDHFNDDKWQHMIYGSDGGAAAAETWYSRRRRRRSAGWQRNKHGLLCRASTSRMVIYIGRSDAMTIVAGPSASVVLLAWEECISGGNFQRLPVVVVFGVLIWFLWWRFSCDTWRIVNKDGWYHNNIGFSHNRN